MHLTDSQACSGHRIAAFTRLRILGTGLVSQRCFHPPIGNGV